MDITWRLSVGRGRGKNGEEVQGRRSIIGRHKTDEERSKVV